MINNRRRILTLKHIAFAVTLIVCFVLQSTPGLFAVAGVRPILLIPAAVTLAMHEGEFVGGLYGALAGALCDLGSFSFYGLYSILLLVLCSGCGLLAVYLLQNSARVALLLCAGVTLIVVLLRFYFDFGLWGYSGISGIFWRQSVPAMVYTLLFTPVFFWLFGRMELYFESKIG